MRKVSGGTAAVINVLISRRIGPVPRFYQRGRLLLLCEKGALLFGQGRQVVVV